MHEGRGWRSEAGHRQEQSRSYQGQTRATTTAPAITTAVPTETAPAIFTTLRTKQIQYRDGSRSASGKDDVTAIVDNMKNIGSQRNAVDATLSKPVGSRISTALRKKHQDADRAFDRSIVAVTNAQGQGQVCRYVQRALLPSLTAAELPATAVPLNTSDASQANRVACFSSALHKCMLDITHGAAPFAKIVEAMLARDVTSSALAEATDLAQLPLFTAFDLPRSTFGDVRKRLRERAESALAS